jgi:DNA repair exonuclease SbcCD nuclease subunit
MRLLHIADVHLERPFRRVGPRHGRQRRAELRSTFRLVVDLARIEKVDALGIAGDLFERENALPEVGQFLRACFADLGNVPVLIAPGNRDYLSPGCLYDQVAWPGNVHIFRTAALSSISVGDGTVWGCAFEGPQRIQSPLAGVNITDGELHVGLFHGDVVESGVESAYAPVAPDDIAASGLRFALLGHVHAGCIDQRRSFAYPGSLEPLDPGEVGPRGAVLLDVTSGETRAEWISVAQRAVLVEEIDLSPISTIADLRRLIAERQPAWEHAEVSLRLLGVLNGELRNRDVIRSAFDDVGVDPEIVARPELDLIGLARQKTTLGAFVRAVQARIEEAHDDDQHQYWSDVLEAGITAFREPEVAPS